MKKILAVALMLAFGGAHAASAIANGSFETSNVDSGDYKYASSVIAAPWSFANGAGIANGNTAWGGTARDLNSYAFLQMAGSSISQEFTAGAGTYTIDFSMAQRTLNVVGAQRVSVYLDGNAISLVGNSTILKPSTYGDFGGDEEGYGGWNDFSYTLANIGAGTHTLTFAGLGSLVGNKDTTVFLDKVSVAVAPVPEPETYAMLLAGMGMLGTIARRRNRKNS